MPRCSGSPNSSPITTTASPTSLASTPTGSRSTTRATTWSTCRACTSRTPPATSRAFRFPAASVSKAAGTWSCSHRTRTAFRRAASCTPISPSPPAANFWRSSIRTAPRSSTSTISPRSLKTFPTAWRCRISALRRRCSRPALQRRRSARLISPGHHLARARLQRRGLADLRPTGLGYENNPGDAINYTSLIATPLPSGTATAYIRVKFNLASLDDIGRLKLRMKYDDGFAAYINGVPVAEANVPETLQWDSAASATHDDAACDLFQEFDISAANPSLHVGENVLAIHALNQPRWQRHVDCARAGCPIDADRQSRKRSASSRRRRPAMATATTCWATPRSRRSACHTGSMTQRNRSESLLPRPARSSSTRPMARRPRWTRI